MDAVVSYYHHYVHIFGWKGQIDDFVQAFLNNELLHTPLNEMSLKFWALKDEENVLFLHYENMNRNLFEVVEKVANFFEKDFSNKQLSQLCGHLSFEMMQNNPALNKETDLSLIRMCQGRENEGFRFFRKGKVGSHKEDLTSQQIERLESYANSFAGTSDFRYKL